MRIKFRKGEQRKFINSVMKLTGSPTLKELINRGIDVKYSSLKNYHTERRLLPGYLFEELLKIARLDKKDFSFKNIENNFGQIIGGKKSKKS